MDWTVYFSSLCRLVASKSKDPSTKVGCIIVDPETHTIKATGYNGFIRGANDEREDWFQRPKKYLVTIHAEQNAICSAAMNGQSLRGCTAYITHHPCSTCTLLLIQAGIKTIVVLEKPSQELKERWKESFEVTREILEESDCDFVIL